MAEQQKIAREISQSFVGRKLKVLCEGEATADALQKANVSSWEHGLIRGSGGELEMKLGSKFVVARGEADAPDIDGRVYIKRHLPAGQFAEVKIIGHTDYDLIAE